MTFFYGSYSTNYRTSRPKDVVCHHCGARSQSTLRSSAHVVHIFFLPVFPYKIEHEIECGNCKTISDFRSLEPESKKSYQKSFKKGFPPVWLFAVPILALGIFVWSLFSNQKERNEYRQRIETIEAGRKIDFVTLDDQYSILKVVKVKDSLVFVSFNKFQTESANGLGKIKDESFYEKDTVELSKGELITWLEEGRILSVYW